MRRVFRTRTDRKTPPRLALVLLEQVLDGDAPLVGDLLEEFERRQSRRWFWLQTLGALVTVFAARRNRPLEIRPLHLVASQPADAMERTRRLNLRFRMVHPEASPLAAAGGLGIVFLGVHATHTAPGIWWLMVAGPIAGFALGGVLVVLRARRNHP